MGTTVKANLVKIGNSKGIRIPKAIIQQVQLSDEVEIEVKDNCLIIKPSKHPRAGWDEAFRKLVPIETEDDLQEWRDFENDEDKNWVWK